MKYLVLMLATAMADMTTPHIDTPMTLPAQELSFARDVQPIIANRCGACHNERTVLPNLQLYSVARANGYRLKSVMNSKRMPLQNITGISDIERSVIKAWVDQGSKK